MELYEMKNGLEKARSLLNELFISIDIDGLKREIEGLTVQTMDENFWNDQEMCIRDRVWWTARCSGYFWTHFIK